MVHVRENVGERHATSTQHAPRYRGVIQRRQVVLAVNVVAKITTQDAGMILIQILDADQANERHLVVKVTSGDLASESIPKIEILHARRITENTAYITAIHLGDDAEPSFGGCDIGLEGIADVEILLFGGRHEIIVAAQVGHNAVFGKIKVVQIVVLQADKRRQHRIVLEIVVIVYIFLERGFVICRIDVGNADACAEIEQVELRNIGIGLHLPVMQVDILVMKAYRAEMFVPIVG